MTYRSPQRSWHRLPRPAADTRWRDESPQAAFTVLPGLTFYFPTRHMARMRAAYTRARKVDPDTYPTFHHFVLLRVTTGLAERCLVLAPNLDNRSPQLADEFLATQLQEAARQLGVDGRTLLYWLIMPQDARREQRWQTIKAVCMRSVSARWGRRGCATPLIGLGAVGILLCCLLSFAEAIAAFLVQHPH